MNRVLPGLVMRDGRLSPLWTVVGTIVDGHSKTKPTVEFSIVRSARYPSVVMRTETLERKVFGDLFTRTLDVK